MKLSASYSGSAPTGACNSRQQLISELRHTWSTALPTQAPHPQVHATQQHKAHTELDTPEAQRFLIRPHNYLSRQLSRTQMEYQSEPPSTLRTTTEPDTSSHDDNQMAH